REHIATLIVAPQRKATRAAGQPGRRLERVIEVQRGRVEGILRRNPGRKQRCAHARSRDQRGDHGNRRPAEAPGEVVVPEPPKNQSTRVNRASGRSSARCTVETFFFIAQGRSWWCRGT